MLNRALLILLLFKVNYYNQSQSIKYKTIYNSVNHLQHIQHVHCFD